MRYLAIIFLAILFFIGFAFGIMGGDRSSQAPPDAMIEIEYKELLATTTTMNITSKAFLNNQEIPPQYTCDSDDVNPPLEFSEIPEDTKSLVLVVNDPDASSGNWVHWTLWNIATSTTGIEEDSVPDGAIEGETSFGKTGYGGPCPPDGEHRYFFKLYALDITLEISPENDKGSLEEAMVGHVLESAELIGLYQR